MGAIIYTGPSNRLLGLRKGAIYAGAIPEHLRKQIESDSALANFFVPLSRHAKTRRARGLAPAPVSAPSPGDRSLPKPSVLRLKRDNLWHFRIPEA
jgi:hypothetical protein